jgi:hypothetical protein
MIADTLRYFEFAACNHIALLCEIQEWAWRNQAHAYGIAATNRLVELGALRRPRPMLVWSQDDVQRDYEDEADAHGVTVLRLIRGGE